MDSNTLTVILAVVFGWFVPSIILAIVVQRRVEKPLIWSCLTVIFGALPFGVGILVLFAPGGLLYGVISILVGITMLAIQWSSMRKWMAPRHGRSEAEATALMTYEVVYRGGLPGYPTELSGAIKLHALASAFVLEPTLGSRRTFKELRIPYRTVSSFRLAERQVSTFEGIVGGLDSHQLNRANNIHIAFRQGGTDLLLRLEMLTGTTVMTQAKKALELEDRLRAAGILAAFASARTGQAPAAASIEHLPVQVAGPVASSDSRTDSSSEGEPPSSESRGLADGDPVAVIERLGRLRDQGLISAEEFELKKSDLLRRL